METKVDGFTVVFRDGVVTVSKPDVPPEDFQVQVAKAYNIVRKFPRSRPGSDWGCDGVGYAIQKQKGIVEVHRSGVGPRKASVVFRSQSLNEVA